MDNNTIMEAIRERHSVRQYMDKPIDRETRSKLDSFVSTCNEESGLHMTIVYDDPEGFDSRLAHYGKFTGVSNYIVLKGADCPNWDQKIGYYGEKIAIYAQILGLNTCWTALTFNKKMVKKMTPAGEKFSMVIALGYGESQGRAHKGKSYADVVKGVAEPAPEWFRQGVEAALLAPSSKPAEIPVYNGRQW